MLYIGLNFNYRLYLKIKLDITPESNINLVQESISENTYHISKKLCFGSSIYKA